MCLLRKITYGEFSEFVREKKITYRVARYYLKWKGIYLWLPDKMEARPKTFDFTQERSFI